MIGRRGLTAPPLFLFMARYRLAVSALPDVLQFKNARLLLRVYGGMTGGVVYVAYFHEKNAGKFAVLTSLSGADAAAPIETMRAGFESERLASSQRLLEALVRKGIIVRAD